MVSTEWYVAGGDGLTVPTTTTKMTVPREGHTLPLARGHDAALAAIRSRGLASAIVGSSHGNHERVLSVGLDWLCQAVCADLGCPWDERSVHRPELAT